MVGENDDRHLVIVSSSSSSVCSDVNEEAFERGEKRESSSRWRKVKISECAARKLQRELSKLSLCRKRLLNSEKNAAGTAFSGDDKPATAAKPF